MKSSYANVTATLALILSMTGVTFAASRYIITNSRQIKPSVLAQIRGTTGATGPAGTSLPEIVTNVPSTTPGPPGPTGPRGFEGERGREGVIGQRGFQGWQGIQGVTGPTGPSEGPTGPTGPQGKVANHTEIIEAESTAPENLKVGEYWAATAHCHTSELITGGGGRVHPNTDEIFATEPSTSFENAWTVAAVKHIEGSITVIAKAICTN